VSSNTYSACLTPDPWLRKIVMYSGHVLCAAGCALLLGLPFDFGWLLLLCAGWAASCWRQLLLLQRGHANCHVLRVRADGGIEVCNCDLEWVSAVLQRDSVVFAKLAWIRARSESGQRYAELLSGDARACPDWRRLQVIWRHIGAAA